MKSTEEALFCNDAFYQAFLSRDVSGMQRVWAEKAQLLCIHPGGEALTGRNDVITSWQAILSHKTCPRILHKVDQVIQHDDIILVTCYEWAEQHPENLLLATNGFVWEAGRYQMVFHQAGPTPIGPLKEDDEPIKPVH